MYLECGVRPTTSPLRLLAFQVGNLSFQGWTLDPYREPVCLSQRLMRRACEEQLAKQAIAGKLRRVGSGNASPVQVVLLKKRSQGRQQVTGRGQVIVVDPAHYHALHGWDRHR